MRKKANSVSMYKAYVYTPQLGCVMEAQSMVNAFLKDRPCEREQNDLTNKTCSYRTGAIDQMRSITLGKWCVIRY